MTGEEKRRKLKEQFKRDLKMRQEYLEKVKKLRQMRNVNKALTDMTDAFNDDSDQWIEQLNQGTALSEAKLDMALEQEQRAQQKLEDLANQAEQEKLNAKNMVEQMKREMGMASEEETQEAVSPEETQAEQNASEGEAPEDQSGKKTLGDW